MSKTISELRAEGYAVVIFNPTELRGVEPQYIEDRLVEHGNNTIDILATDDDDVNGCDHDWVESNETGRTYCLNCGEDGDG